MSWNFSLSALANSLTKLNLGGNVLSVRKYIRLPPRYRPPKWHVKKDLALRDEMLTNDNKEFVQETIKDRIAKLQVQPAIESVTPDSPLNTQLPVSAEWNPSKRRVGLIGKKIGCYPLWDNKGKKYPCTLIQIVENQVVKYTPPEEHVQRRPLAKRIKNRRGVLLVGAETIDPSQVTREYYGLFERSGVPPKKHLCRFFVSPDAQLPPGTPLTASHFRVGDRIDINGLTIDRGFQGVMKRWGFKGMPASHGVTKTHRRPGNIGSGGTKARVMPGTKLPGHMGNRWRTLKGVKILRINTKYNVIYCHGLAIAGPTGGLVYLYDTLLPLRKPTTPLPYPTYFETGKEEEDILFERIHPFDAPTIEFQPE